MTTMLILARCRPMTPASRVARGLVLLGRVSDVAYPWNHPLALWLRSTPLQGFGDVAGVPLTLGIAALSWRYVENRPGRKATAP